MKPEESPEWISVKDALPKEGELVMLKWDDEDPFLGSYEEHTHCMLGSRAGSKGAGFRDDENKLAATEVTHWKPIDKTTLK